MLIAVAMALPWFVAADRATDGAFTDSFFVYHHVRRAFGGAPALAGHPWWMYGPRFLADFLPWTPILMVGCVWAIRSGRWRDDADARFGAAWLVGMVVVLSGSRFKRADYLLPAYAGAAILLGCLVERWCQLRGPSAERRVTLAVAAVGVCCAIGWVGFDRWVTRDEEAKHGVAAFAGRVREFVPAPDAVVLFRVENHLLAYHLGRPLRTLIEWPHLRDHLARPGPRVFVTRAEYVDECRSVLGEFRYEVAARSADFAPVPQPRPLVVLRKVDDGPPP